MKLEELGENKDNVLAEPTSMYRVVSNNLNHANIRKIIFTSDIYKVDDRNNDRGSNPQTINIEWIKALFGNILAELFVDNVNLITGNENSPINRLHAYRRFGLPFSSASWAEIYDAIGDIEFEQRIAEYFSDSLVISFEMPPYLAGVLSRADVPFIDLSIHPIRFLPDYMFGLRSNITSIYERAFAVRMPDHVIDGFARISNARTVRVMRGWRPVPGSAVFFGQTAIDASLISDGRLWGVSDVEDALADLALSHSRVYYKFHPHLKERAEIDRIVSGIKRCEVVEVGAYDIMACPEVDVFASLSSGTLNEAARFGGRTKRYINRDDHFSLVPGHVDISKYVAQTAAIFSKEYWKYILGYTDEIRNSFPDFKEHALRATLNMKWAR